MASQQDLLAAVKESLERQGSMCKLRAEVRAEVMSVLTFRGVQPTKPKMPQEVWLINEMIREYLIWNGYKYTSSILTAECGLSDYGMSRPVMARELGVSVTDDVAHLPLLYSLVMNHRKKGEECVQAEQASMMKQTATRKESG